VALGMAMKYEAVRMGLQVSYYFIVVLFNNKASTLLIFASMDGPQLHEGK
jgi:hypothetical protein